MTVERFIFWVTCLLALEIENVACTTVDVSELHEIEDFLATCESQMIFDDSYKDVVLVLGNTGAGKSTFTEWITSDGSTLTSAEFVKRSGEFVIVDNNKIGNSTIQSKTIFPELLVDKDTGTAYYDISGFSDTRGIKHDIATSYFIKRIIDHVEKIKILLVVSHSAVRKGVDRLDLIRLLRHFTVLVKNTDRYHNGIGLVVTKVDNSYIVESDDSVSLVGDEAVKSSIVAFLQDVAGDLEENAESQTTSFEDQIFAYKTIGLINALLSTDNELYEKIALFRRPNRSGPVNKITLLQKAKLRAQTMVTQNLQFIPKHSDDFSYTVSDETKNKLHDLLKSLEKSLEENVKTVGNNIFNRFNELLDNIQHKIQHEVDIHDTNTIDFHLTTIYNVTKLVDEAISEISTLEFSLDINERPQDIPSLINRTLFHLNVKDISQSTLSDILSIANFLDFIQITSILKFKLNSKPLKQAIHEVMSKLEQASTTVKENYSKLLIDVDNNVKSMIQMSVIELKDKLINYEKNVYDIKKLSEQMSHFCLELSKNLNDSDSDTKFTNLKLDSHKIALTDYTLEKIKQEKYALYFKNEIQILMVYFCDSQKWYEFLNVLYNKLSTYDVQKKKITKSHCNAFVYGTNKYENRKVDDTNIDLILRDCFNDLYNAEYNEIKNVNLTHYKVNLLQTVVNLTLSNDSFSQYCYGSKLTVKGRFVILSAINISTCNSLSFFEIFGTEKVFIDTDLDFTGKNIQMSVMAPTWEIIGERIIVLNGSPGRLILPRKAADDEDGKPGNPGGNAGDFLGFGGNFVNGDNLTIFANGGNASSGQEGGNGAPGIDPNFTFHDEKKTCNYIIVYCTENVEQQSDCSNGRDGRLGGVGAIGGAAGIVKLYSNAPVKVTAIKGKDGDSGSVGTPGRAGISARKEIVSETKVWLLFGSITIDKNVDYQYSSCRSGNVPDESKTLLERQESPSKSEFINSTVFIEFNNLLRQNFEMTLRKGDLIKSIFWVNQSLYSYIFEVEWESYLID